MRVLLICLLFSGCAQSRGKYSVDSGPLKNDFEGAALVLIWSYRNDIKLGKLVDYRSEQKAVYFSYKTTKGTLRFKVFRNPKRVELLSDAGKNAVPLDAGSSREGAK